MNNHIGFTGTRKGITPLQRNIFQELLSDERWDEPQVFHHGGCVGADAQVHSIVQAFGHYEISVWPGNLTAQRHYTIEPPYYIHAIRPPLDRNQMIVDHCNVLIAISGTEEETLRSGAWATIRYARKQGKRIIIITPSGQIIREGVETR